MQRLWVDREALEERGEAVALSGPELEERKAAAREIIGCGTPRYGEHSGLFWALSLPIQRKWSCLRWLGDDRGERFQAWRW
jgi:hypothetical protein